MCLPPPPRPVSGKLTKKSCFAVRAFFNDTVIIPNLELFLTQVIIVMEEEKKSPANLPYCLSCLSLLVCGTLCGLVTYVMAYKVRMRKYSHKIVVQLIFIQLLLNSNLFHFRQNNPKRMATYASIEFSRALEWY